MADDDTRHDDEVERDVRDLLAPLKQHTIPVPGNLAARTLRRAYLEITGAEVLELATEVFVLRFCAPFLDLVASLVSRDPEGKDERE